MSAPKTSSWSRGLADSTCEAMSSVAWAVSWAMLAGPAASAIVISSQHDAEVKNEQLRAEIEEKVIRNTVSSELLDNDTKIHINPTGRFVTGGPQGSRIVIAETVEHALSRCMNSDEWIEVSVGHFRSEQGKPLIAVIGPRELVSIKDIA